MAQPRKVILHAPKNGFFFVIDRTNGKFISAKNFVDVNWATGYDANGRPIEVPDARSPDKPFDTVPGPYGAHNWHPMSFNPNTGLVYLPAQNIPVNLTGQKNWKHDAKQPGEFMGNLGWNVGYAINATPPKAPMFGRLIAWDPVKQKEAWRQEHVSPWNGGTLTTAGNLVFQGTADGRFVAYNATSGEKLWETADRHRRGGGRIDLHGRRQAVRVGGGGLGRRVRRDGARDGDTTARGRSIPLPWTARRHCRPSPSTRRRICCRA